MFRNWIENKEQLNKSVNKSIDEIVYGDMDEKTDALSKKEHPLFKGRFKVDPPPSNTSKETIEELKELEKMSHFKSKDIMKDMKDFDVAQVKPFEDYLKQNSLDFDFKMLNKILKQGEILGLKLKKKFNRPRPHQIAPKMGLNIMYHDLKTDDTPAYPSNHSLISSLIALYLSSLYPKHEKGFMDIADRIGISRLYGGTHYRSDHDSARKLAKDIMKSWKPAVKPAKYSFTEWMLKLEDQGIHAFMRVASEKYKDDRSKDILVIYGNTTPIKDKLKEITKFTWNQGGYWSTGRWSLNNDVIQKLIELTGITDLKEIIDAGPQFNADSTEAEEEKDAPKSQVDAILGNMEQEIENAKGKAGGKAKQILTMIENYLEKLANLVDEEIKSGFVKDFMRFAAKFHNYSFNNQMLIYAQKKDATYVNSESRWLKLGRAVTNKDQGIIILAPMTGKKKEKDADLEGQKEERKFVFFRPVKVYDISSTQVISGQEDKAKVFEPNDWRQDTDENTEELTLLINAGIEIAKQKDISIDYEELAQGTGGYSAGGKIVINNTYGGINKFSTLVHELAHEILHQVMKPEERAKENKRDFEYDAESVAYIVLQYFGFETKDSPRYIALWKGDSKAVKGRRENISKASKEIIQGIKKNVEDMVIQDDLPEEDAA
jgi:hypothetical protein